MVRFLIVKLLIFFAFSSTYSQKEITINEFLDLTNRISLQKKDSLYSKLESIQFKSYLISGIQIRTETKNFQHKRQEYSLRINPTNYKVSKNENKIFKNEIEDLKLENQLYFNEELVKKYEIIINTIFNNEFIFLCKKQLKLLKNKLNILSNKIYDDTFNVKDLLDTEENIQSLELKLSVYELEVNNLKNVFAQYLNSNEDVFLKVNKIIKPEKIINSIYNFSREKDLTFLTFKNKLHLLNNEKELEIAKSGQVIDYFQVKYSGANNPIFKEVFSVGLGLNLPIFNKVKQQKNKYFFEELKLIHNYKLLKKEKLILKKEKNGEFALAKLNYKTLVRHKKNSSIANLLQTYEKIEGISPLTTLGLKILMNKKDIEIIEAKHNLYLLYIEIMALNGELFKKPLRNFLD